MASLKKQTEIAVYAALNVSAVTTLATGGVHLGIARDTSIPPFIVFNWQAFDSIDYTFDFGQAIEGGLLLVKSYADEDSDTSKTASTLNDEILEACRTILHAGISLGTGDLMYLRKVADAPEIQENLSGIPLTMNGTFYKVIAQ